YVLDVLNHEPVSFWEKSRTMMMSWIVSGWAAHMAFTHPATCVVFQSEDEDRAVHDVMYAKTLWENSPALLREQWPLSKPLDKQTTNEFTLANGSRMLGIPGNPDKIRSEPLLWSCWMRPPTFRRASGATTSPPRPAAPIWLCFRAHGRA